MKTDSRSRQILICIGVVLSCAFLQACGTEGTCTGASRFGASGSTQCSKADLEFYPGTSTSAVTKFDYGILAYTSSSSVSFSLKNVGSAKMENFSVVNAPSYPFYYLGDGEAYPGLGGTCGNALESGDTCKLVLKFAPTQGAWGSTTGSSFSYPLKVSYTTDGQAKSNTLTITGSSDARCGNHSIRSNTMITDDTALQKLTNSTNSAITKVAAATWRQVGQGLSQSVDGFKLKMKKSPGTTVNAFRYKFLKGHLFGCAALGPCTNDAPLAAGELTVGANSLITETVSEVGLPLSGRYSMETGNNYFLVFEADLSTGGAIEYQSYLDTAQSGDNQTYTYFSTNSGNSFTWATPTGAYSDWNVGFKVISCD